VFIDFDAMDMDELEQFADALPGRHAWAHGTENIFYCRCCHISFAWGEEPVPEDGPCEPVEIPP
jgi:hypothetical protein